MDYTIDTAHTLIEFSAKHMMVTTVKGRFSTFSGDIEYDEGNPHATRIDVTVDVGSLTTGQEQRDAHLRSADFFDAESFPKATYVSKRVEELGRDRYRVIGDLTIRGTTREVALDVEIEGRFKNLQGAPAIGFTAKTSFNRKDFGLNWNVALESGGWLVSEQIKVAIEGQAFAVAAPAQEEAAASA